MWEVTFLIAVCVRAERTDVPEGGREGGLRVYYPWLLFQVEYGEGILLRCFPIAPIGSNQGEERYIRGNGT